MSDNKNNAVPIWVSNSPNLLEIASCIGVLMLVRPRLDDTTKAKIDDLITDLKTYTK